MTMSFRRPLAHAVAAIATSALMAGTALAQPAAPDPARPSTPNPEMKAVLDALVALEAKPIHTLSVPEARTQASAADAAITVARDEGISPLPEAKLASRDVAIPSPAGALPARVYLPAGEGPFPVIVYFHGGGWVLADVNTYDATPRALALGADAIVVSADYRHAPEAKFPAQHEDAWTAYAWTVENIHLLNGDAGRVAVVGESAGGNLAANVALEAKAREATLPVRQVLVYPIAGNDMTTPSYVANADAAPLGKADMEWFVDKVFASKDQTADPRINLVGRDDLAGLPPATVVTAEIDPLRSEGQAYAEKLAAAGVAVNAIDVPAVAHEFFGMAKVVPDAKRAVDAVVADLKTSFAQQ